MRRSTSSREPNPVPEVRFAGWESYRMSNTTAASILVVEDEPLILLDVETALVDAGFEVIAATSGAMALDRYNTQGGQIRALLTDIRLGKGPDGWDVARHCREANPGLPVIYVSADSAGAWSSRGVPCSVMISKPFVMAQIVTALSTLLNEASQASAIASPPLMRER